MFTVFIVVGRELDIIVPRVSELGGQFLKGTFVQVIELVIGSECASNPLFFVNSALNSPSFPRAPKLFISLANPLSSASNESTNAARRVRLNVADINTSPVLLIDATVNSFAIFHASGRQRLLVIFALNVFV